jgi:hypothetical protein
MSNISAFQQQQNTIAVTTSATASTAGTLAVNWPVSTLQGFGLHHSSMQARIRTDPGNTADVWISFGGDGGDTATIPTPGTPSREVPYAANSVEIAAGIGGHVASINYISSAASQKFYVTFGEGL